MSTSSKYANLPFIASGEKDIFETDDLPEADQVSIQQPLYDASVEIIPTGTVDAYQKFAASVNNESLKFEKEVDESYVDKFNRLKVEVEELQNLAKSNQGENFSSEVDNLVTKLDNLQGFYFKKVDTFNVDNIKPVQNLTNDSPLVKYELYRKPHHEQLVEQNKINFVEQRINKIENLLGINETIKDSNNLLINNYLKDQSVMNVVVQLSNKVVQLDHSSIDKIEARLNLIAEKLNQVSEKKLSLDLEKENKLNQLHNHYVKVNKNENLMPNILERLQILNNLQEQASQFSSTLKAMDNLQNEIKTSVEKNNENLKTFKELFESKTETIKQIIDDFNQRLDKLK